MKINKIDISSVRGISSIQLHCNGHNVLIFGENGTGKSSIVDALEFFFTGEIARFKGVQGLSFEQHCPHKNSKPEDMKVELAIQGFQTPISRTIKKKPVVSGNLREAFTELEDGSFILRRAQILTFIISQPAKRYQAIASMIGIDHLDSIETKMGRVKKEYEKEAKQQSDAIKAIVKKFGDMFSTSPTRLSDIIPSINSRLMAVDLPPISSIDDLDTYLLRPEISSYDIHLSEKIQSIRSRFIGIPHNLFSQDLITSINEIERFVSSYELDERVEFRRILSLLESGEQYLKETNEERCPLCWQEIRREQLLGSITHRLGELRQFREQSTKVNKQANTVAKDIGAIISRLEKPLRIAQQCPETIPLFSQLKENVGRLQAYVALLEQTHSREQNINIDECQQIFHEIEEILKQIENFGNQEVQKITPSPSEDNRIKALVLIEQLKTAKSEIAEHEAERIELDKKLNLSEKILRTYSDIRKRNIQGIYDRILVDVEKYYQHLHPDEPTAEISLTIATAKAGSAELTVDYCEKEDEDPRAFLSEGHLDSLGLCIFLAFIKGMKPKCPLIVLDDVVTTIDSGHRERVCSLIYNEFSASQVILTTHDGVWNEQLRNYQRAYSVNSSNFELIEWTPDDGPIAKTNKSSWETIKEKLQNGDRNGAGNEGRRYLEYVLDHHCSLLGAKIPYRGGSQRYGVGELYDAFRSRVNELFNPDDYSVYIHPSFQELDRTTYIGNRLSHHNERALDLSISEVKSFCEAVHRLDDLLICPQCKRGLYYYRKENIITCSNPLCSHPLCYITKQ